MEFDQETVNIQTEYLAAKRKYVQRMFPIHLKQFEHVLKSKNKTHKRPNKFDETINNETTNSKSKFKSKSITELFRKLSRRFHPDKLDMMENNQSDTTELNELYQEIVRHYHDNNYDTLSYIDKHGELPKENGENASDIDYENTIAFQWGECKSQSIKDYYEDMFVTKHEYKKLIKEIQDELRKENDDLIEQIKHLKQQNARLRKLCENDQDQ